MVITIALIAYLDFESFVIRQLHPLLEQKGFKVESIFLKARDANALMPTEKEIADKLKIEQKAARYFLTNKEKIEKEIIRAINLFHPDEDIKKPYS